MTEKTNDGVRILRNGSSRNFTIAVDANGKGVTWAPGEVREFNEKDAAMYLNYHGLVDVEKETTVATQVKETIDAQRARIRELEAENAELRAKVDKDIVPEPAPANAPAPEVKSKRKKG